MACLKNLFPEHVCYTLVFFFYITPTSQMTSFSMLQLCRFTCLFCVLPVVSDRDDFDNID